MASRSASMSTPSPCQQAIEHACNMRYHQRLLLPATDRHGPLRVTYATTSNFDDTSLPTALFIGPMFGSRWILLQTEHLSKEIGVRIVFTDRPGMGGSTMVPLNQRVQVWLETVAPLLKKLDVDHVSLLTHSAGTIYTMSTLYHMRHILDPDKPYVAFMAPWVHNTHSNATLMNLASRIPSSVVGGLDGLNRFINQRIMPSVGWSAGAIMAVAGLFNTADQVAADESTEAKAEKYDVSVDVWKELDGFIEKCFYAENTEGGSEDAKLCLKKGGPGTWGVCEDYEEYVCKLVESEKVAQSNGNGEGQTPKLKVEAFFSASDIMIGKGGQNYFNRSWRKEILNDTIEFNNFEMTDTNHDSILVDQKKGCLRRILEEIKGSRSTS